tara:strand:+ start:924 stop:1112 length:189 start_codon:yes stop_codon:yes gene_type:complete
MLYKKKQVYWIDSYIGGKRLKICTEIKDKARAQKFLFNLIKESMIKKRLREPSIPDWTKPLG